MWVACVLLLLWDACSWLVPRDGVVGGREGAGAWGFAGVVEIEAAVAGGAAAAAVGGGSLGCGGLLLVTVVMSKLS